MFFVRLDLPVHGVTYCSSHSSVGRGMELWRKPLFLRHHLLYCWTWRSVADKQVHHCALYLPGVDRCLQYTARGCLYGAGQARDRGLSE